MAKTVCFVPDLHIPIHDARKVEALIKFIGDFHPDQVIIIGDLMDFKPVSRWSKDQRAEFEGSVIEDCALARDTFFKPLRKVYSGYIGMHMGNHEERLADYIEKNAPGLSSAYMLHIPHLLEFNGNDVHSLPWLHQWAPGWASTHGHLGGISLSKTGGGTALGAALDFGLNVVCGHTHRLGMISSTGGWKNNESTLTGVEVGHMINLSRVDYLKEAAPNWQAGFAVGYWEEDKYAFVNPIPVTNHFVVEGNVYEI